VVNSWTPKRTWWRQESIVPSAIRSTSAGAWWHLASRCWPDRR